MRCAERIVLTSGNPQPQLGNFTRDLEHAFPPVPTELHAVVEDDGLHASSDIHLPDEEPARLRALGQHSLCLRTRTESSDVAKGVRQTGKFGVDIGEEEGHATARAVMLTLLATVKAEVGSLDKVKQVVRIFGMCNAAPDYVLMPQVIDGASDLLYELFGPEIGCHARSAVGIPTLPRGMAVEINGEFEVE
ncbi:MAG: RidA family protein [Rubrivivax sp.]